MWFRRLSLFEFCSSFIYSFMHQFRSLFVCGFLPSLPYCFAFFPSPFPPFQENGGLAPLLPALPRFSATRACASNASDRVVTALDATPASRCNVELWDSRGSTLLLGWFSQKQNQLGIMTIHPSHAYQHGSSRGLQNDALPASAGSQVMMSLKSLWPVTQELK